MAALKIDADALFRAVIAHDYKLMGYYLDLRTGEVVSKTLSPDQVKDVPRGPVVKPLPAFGHDINERKGDAPFGPPPVELGKKPDLFKDDGPKKNAFEGDFWKRESGKKLDPFGGGGPRKESSTKRLAELFGEKPAGASALKADPFAPQAVAAGGSGQPAPHPLPPLPQGERGMASGGQGMAGTEARPTTAGSTTLSPTAASAAATGSSAGSATTANPIAARSPDPSGATPIDVNQPLQRIPPASEEQLLEWMRAFAKDCGDPAIREKLLHAAAGAKAMAGYERVLRNYQRMNQQWERYLYKQSLHYAAAWLKEMPIQWEIVEPSAPPRPV
ncbi:MAG: hypothetical protein HY291_17790 [Planctomycetes bacterium]|nr:hypothetical protein [Planctomycetota bacterium]